MSDGMTKARKKEAKAAAKIEKARTRAAGGERTAAGPATAGQAAPEDGGSFRAGLMRFVKEGAFQTIVRVVAGLVVGYLLIKFGLR